MGSGLRNELRGDLQYPGVERRAIRSAVEKEISSQPWLGAETASSEGGGSIGPVSFGRSGSVLEPGKILPEEQSATTPAILLEARKHAKATFKAEAPDA